MAGDGQYKWQKYFDSSTITKLAHIGFKPSDLVEGNLVGEHRSPFHGFAIEFAGHRGYVPGDDVKHVDWKAYYKTDRYLIKQYAQETNFLAHILVDVSESMRFEYKSGRRIDYAAFIATALAQLIVNQSDSVGAYFFDNSIVSSIRVTNSEEIVSKLADSFDRTEAKAPGSIGKILSLVAEQIGKRRIVFVISDLFGDIDETFDGIKRLLDDRHEVILIQIIDPLELDFSILGRVELIELEGEEKLEIIGADIRDAYQKLFHGFLDSVREQSLSLGIDHVLCDMSKPFGLHMAEYLSGRTFKGA